MGKKNKQSKKSDPPVRHAPGLNQWRTSVCHSEARDQPQPSVIPNLPQDLSVPVQPQISTAPQLHDNPAVPDQYHIPPLLATYPYSMVTYNPVFQVTASKHSLPTGNLLCHETGQLYCPATGTILQAALPNYSGSMEDENKAAQSFLSKSALCHKEDTNPDPKSTYKLCPLIKGTPNIAIAAPSHGKSVAYPGSNSATTPKKECDLPPHGKHAPSLQTKLAPMLPQSASFTQTKPAPSTNSKLSTQSKPAQNEPPSSAKSKPAPSTRSKSTKNEQPPSAKSKPAPYPQRKCAQNERSPSVKSKPSPSTRSKSTKNEQPPSAKSKPAPYPQRKCAQNERPPSVKSKPAPSTWSKSAPNERPPSAKSKPAPSPQSKCDQNKQPPSVKTKPAPSTRSKSAQNEQPPSAKSKQEPSTQSKSAHSNPAQFSKGKRARKGKRNPATRKKSAKPSSQNPPINKTNNKNHGCVLNVNKRYRPPRRKATYYPSQWSFIRPFNRRKKYPTKSRHKGQREPVWKARYKNCIGMSMVHEIIHSQILRGLVSSSQIKTLLNSGGGQCRTAQPWTMRMEEEALHKYKKLKLERENQRVKLSDFDVHRHPEKSWLVGYGRLVTDRHTKDSWMLLVKCIYKHPDSTLRQASKHRSFCLEDYTLRKDHDYYTQLHCLMAITNTEYAELLVHTNKETLAVPVWFDFDFWDHTEAMLQRFYTEKVLPFLMKRGLMDSLTVDGCQLSNNIACNLSALGSRVS
ncbi:LOW QUALITY PROTEIN: uncharacterized protein O3C94_003066 [Discoglossus pictus]